MVVLQRRCCTAAVEWRFRRHKVRDRFRKKADRSGRLPECWGGFFERVLVLDAAANLVPAELLAMQGLMAPPTSRPTTAMSVSKGGQGKERTVPGSPDGIDMRRPVPGEQEFCPEHD